MKSGGMAAIGAAVIVLGWVSQAVATDIPVTTCGQVVIGDGILTGNLDCSGFPGAAVVLTDHSSLDLATFTLSGGDGDGVLCENYCLVRSDDPGLSGTIAGFAGDGVVARNPTGSIGTIRINRVTIRDNGGSGVRVDEAEGSITVSKSALLGNDGMGVSSPQKLYIARSTISGNALDGVHAERASVRECLLEGNGVGIDVSLFLNVDHSDIVANLGDGIRLGNSARIYVVHVEGNGASGIVFSAIGGYAKVQFAEVSDNVLDGIRVDGPQTERLKIKLVFARRNGRHGVVAKHLLVTTCRIDDNAFHGIYMPPGGEPCRIGISQYSMVGNGTDPTCGVSTTCADIATCDPPLNLAESTTCDRSYDSGSGFPGTNWGICDDD